MPHRAALVSVLASMTVGAGLFALSGCSGGATPHPSMMGSVGTAGATASGAAGDNSGAAGTSASGAAGDSGGAAGDSGGAAGTAASGAGGTTGAGQAGSGTTGAAGGGAGGSTPPVTGTGGAVGAAGTSGGRPSGPTAACMADAPPDPIGKAVKHTLTVTVAPEYQPAYVSRYYYTTLPTGFDPTKPYPMVFYGQGCGQTGDEGSSWTSGMFLTDVIYIQLIPATVTGATVVPSNGSPGCFQAGKQGGTDSPDGPYFDQVLAEVESKYCVEKSKVWVSGSSSGAWLSNFLGCARGNVIRGITADSGGLQHDHPTCTGGAAVMEMPGDSTSSIVDGFDIGVGPARDTFIATNGCSMTPTSMMTFGTASCEVYGNCASPVVWCNVGGAHQSGQGYIAASSWALWNTLQ